jgi:hypothetical protein
LQSKQAPRGWQEARHPHREVIEEENADLMASLEGHSWAAYAEAYAEADFFDLGTDDDPMLIVKDHLHHALRRTGSIGADHRKDYVEMARAAKPATVALGVATPEPAKQPKVGLP